MEHRRASGGAAPAGQFHPVRIDFPDICLIQILAIVAGNILHRAGLIQEIIVTPLTIGHTGPRAGFIHDPAAGQQIHIPGLGIALGLGGVELLVALVQAHIPLGFKIPRLRIVLYLIPINGDGQGGFAGDRFPLFLAQFLLFCRLPSSPGDGFCLGIRLVLEPMDPFLGPGQRFHFIQTLDGRLKGGAILAAQFSPIIGHRCTGHPRQR